MADINLKVQDRSAIKAALKREFIKQTYNPHRHASGEGGVVFDPAVQRFMSMRVSFYEHFKPTIKTSLYAMGLLVIPFLGYGYYMKVSRENLEHQYRTGQVAYKDRFRKFY